MAKYTVKCSECGCEFTVNLVGPTSRREWMLKNREWTCQECYDKTREEARERREAEHAAENAACAEANAKQGLPALQGTPKQVAWAETIRAKALDDIRGTLADTELRPRIIREAEAQTSASWWIDRRTHSAMSLIRELFDAVATPQERLRAAEEDFEHLKGDLGKGGILGAAAKAAQHRLEEARAAVERGESAPAEEPAEPEPVAVSVLEPKTVCHDEIGEVSEDAERKTVAVTCERDEYVRLALKRAGFVWQDGAWRYSGGLHRYAADYAVATLLRYGHRIKGRSAAPESAPTRFCAMAGDSSYALLWWDKDEDWYTEAKRLPKARWDRGRMLVPVEYANEVADFARINGFEVTRSARAAIEVQRGAAVEADAPRSNPPCETVPLVPADGSVAESLRDDA